MKKGVIILLYSVGLLGVISLILISTYEPQNFTVEIGKSQRDIVKLTEISQNYQNFIYDSAVNAAYNSRFYDSEDFELNFISDFEDRLNQYPPFFDDYDLFEYSIYMNYDFQFGNYSVNIIGKPDQILDTEFYLDSLDLINEGEEKFVRDHILISSSNMDFKFYPYFKINSDYGLDNPQNDEKNNE